MQKTRVAVEIAGQMISLSGTDNEDYIRSVAHYVQKNVRTIEEKQPALSVTNCLIMAALHITEELFSLRQQYEELDGRIEELRALSLPKPPPAKRTAKAPEKHPFESNVPVR